MTGNASPNMDGILRPQPGPPMCLHGRPQRKLALALQKADPTGVNHWLVRVTETTALGRRI